ncbi:MAG: signal peptidase I [Proteobacteria bacterium]|nr:signal peptidase I [Pseudomonadota bacterium]
MFRSIGHICTSCFDRHDDRLETIIYSGPSMNPTLKALDILLVAPYNGRKIRCGDVIVFFPPGSDSRVTHRVISTDAHKVITQGDNNPNVDAWTLGTHDIIGRVIYAQRRTRRLRIYGGGAGRCYAAAARVSLLINLKISIAFGPFYNWLAKAGVFRCCLPARLSPKVISFSRPVGTELQLLMGKLVIGRCLSGMDHWQIRRPFRLFVDESSLPRVNFFNATVSEQETNKGNVDPVSAVR